MAGDFGALIERLKCEGRLEEARSYYRERRSHYSSLGIRGVKLENKAYGDLSKAFPPLRVAGDGLTVDLAEGEEDEEFVSFDAASLSSFNEVHGVPESWGVLPATVSYSVEVNWVFVNLMAVVKVVGESKVPVLDLESALSPAPSLGALNLLNWAKDNRNEFFKSTVLKMKARDVEEDMGKKERYERKSIQEIRAILGEFVSLDGA